MWFLSFVADIDNVVLNHYCVYLPFLAIIKRDASQLFVSHAYYAWYRNPMNMDAAAYKGGNDYLLGLTMNNKKSFERNHERGRMLQFNTVYFHHSPITVAKFVLHLFYLSSIVNMQLKIALRWL